MPRRSAWIHSVGPLAPRAWLAAAAARARRLWEARFTPEKASAALRTWLESPRHGPPARTFRALRFLDRLLGRSGGPAR